MCTCVRVHCAGTGVCWEAHAVDPKDCNQCNLCAFVCPHSCIRPFLLTPEEAKSSPPGIETLRAKDGGKQMKYTLQVSGRTPSA